MFRTVVRMIIVDFNMARILFCFNISGHISEIWNVWYSWSESKSIFCAICLFHSIYYNHWFQLVDNCIPLILSCSALQQTHGKLLCQLVLCEPFFLPMCIAFQTDFFTCFKFYFNFIQNDDETSKKSNGSTRNDLFYETNERWVITGLYNLNSWQNSSPAGQFIWHWFLKSRHLIFSTFFC